MRILTLILLITSWNVMQAQDLSNALREGEHAKMFVLNNAEGIPVSLDTLLKKGPVVLTWYRGSWCPYCNLALADLQEKLPQIQASGATLVALTPELPDNSLSLKEKRKLEFEVLSDLNNQVARLYGIVFTLSPETAARYEKSFGLTQHNGSDSGELPVPATYVIDKDGVIRYAYLNADYKERADPEVIIAELQKLK